MHECINRMDITMCSLYENNYTTYPDCFRMFELTATKGTEKKEKKEKTFPFHHVLFLPYVEVVSQYFSTSSFACFVSTNLQNIMFNRKHAVYGILI